MPPGSLMLCQPAARHHGGHGLGTTHCGLQSDTNSSTSAIKETSVAWRVPRDGALAGWVSSGSLSVSRVMRRGESSPGGPDMLLLPVWLQRRDWHLLFLEGNNLNSHRCCGTVCHLLRTCRLPSSVTPAPLGALGSPPADAVPPGSEKCEGHPASEKASSSSKQEPDVQPHLLGSF